MPRVRSLIVQVDVDTAGRAHNCQANGRHRIERGEVRLKVTNGRGWDHYCRACALTIIDRDAQKLAELLQRVTAADAKNPV